MAHPRDRIAKRLPCSPSSPATAADHPRRLPDDADRRRQAALSQRAKAAAARPPCRTSATRSPRPRTAATMAPDLAATIFAAQVQDHERSAGPWRTEWPTLPTLLLVTSGGLAAIVDIAEGTRGRCCAHAPQPRCHGRADHGGSRDDVAREKIGKSDAHHLIGAASKRAVAKKNTCATCCRQMQDHRTARRRRDRRLVRADGLSGRSQVLIDRLLASLND